LKNFFFVQSLFPQKQPRIIAIFSKIVRESGGLRTLSHQGASYRGIAPAAFVVLITARMRVIFL